MLRCVLTGGSLSGKTKVLGSIKQYLSDFEVHCIPESASELLSEGVVGGTVDFQRKILKRSLENEQRIEPDIQSNEECIIIFDRGLADGKAYLTEDEWQMLTDEINITDSEIMQRYDIIIFLKSILNIEPEKAISTGNDLRLEQNPDEVLALEKRLCEIYGKHPNCRFIEPCDDINEKIKTVAQIIAAYHR